MILIKIIINKIILILFFFIKLIIKLINCSSNEFTISFNTIIYKRDKIYFLKRGTYINIHINI